VLPLAITVLWRSLRALKRGGIYIMIDPATRIAFVIQCPELSARVRRLRSVA
jgi:hypothetical protein